MRFGCLATLLAAFLTFAALPGQAQERIGVLVLHGKSPGSQNDPYSGQFRSALANDGMITLMPDMPWSARRYIDGDWDQAMAEIDRHVKSLRDKGATRIVIAGHSMGCPAAMGYAVKYGTVDALVLLAPGHVPDSYYNFPPLRAVHDSIDEARRLVAAGQGDTRRDFEDSNQGTSIKVRTTARNYLSYFDPNSDAEMSRTAARIPAQIPVLWVIGDKDPMFRRGRDYAFSKLPANPKSRYLEVAATHLTTPVVGTAEALAWIKAAIQP
ncbi:MAG: alpha/beta hydrolase [Ferrovibrio sp.]|uniref:alpha/beta hydrolase n=1 Tax=Ferrovibrio sp. TaxID=1917215 RepID=UPI00262C4EAE|nr:alpha/beta hydrolase [Ferrovibrio sp.]MCW0236219.1 alpha/beta hydrolase [Ferrovibrio sp.]